MKGANYELMLVMLPITYFSGGPKFVDVIVMFSVLDKTYL